jgi:hypothetical protein
LFYFSFRAVIFNIIFKRIGHKLQNKYNLQLSVNNYEYKGARSILLEGFTVKDSVGDTLVYADSLFFQLRVFPLFTGKIRFLKFYADDVTATLGGELIDKIFFSKKDKTSENDTLKRHNFSKSIDNIFNTLFSAIPNEIIVDSVSLSYHRGKNNFIAFCPEFIMSDGKFKGNIILSDEILNSNCQISGRIDKSNNNIEIELCSANSRPVTIPYITKRWGTTIKFDTLRYSFNYLGFDWGKLKFTGSGEASGLTIQNYRIAPNPVVFHKGAINFVFNVGEKYIELDSSSSISINSFRFYPYLKYLDNGEKETEIKIQKMEFGAAKLFASFPDGLFTSVRNMKVSGNLGYEFKCYINWDIPDSIRLYSKLENNGFQILHYGLSNLVMMNDTFTYQALENDQSVHNIFIGPGNPDFVFLDDISPFLRYSVLTAEDADFFFHKGFNEESFKNSIAANIKERRFVRGGSTITMQLVKNVFLTRNKTISRKLEEILIVWMIENLHLTSKERMFEVYLNIIEWGPGIYGIKQAAWYYFKKKPSALTLQQSIFLASIIPSPKYFKSAFKSPGHLTNYFAWFYSRLPDFMVRRGQIQPEDTIGLKPEVRLTGKAKDYNVIPDSAVLDSLRMEGPEIIEELLAQPEK